VVGKALVPRWVKSAGPKACELLEDVVGVCHGGVGGGEQDVQALLGQVESLSPRQTLALPGTHKGGVEGKGTGGYRGDANPWMGSLAGCGDLYTFWSSCIPGSRLEYSASCSRSVGRNTPLVTVHHQASRLWRSQIG
jgi:hypothetical protein